MSEQAPREVTPPPIQQPSAKEKKYDRQLRLWAASGQRALEESHVLLIVGSNGSNSSVAGVETLKNLILPSIGHFTIADSATVTEADLGVNFFLEQSSLGKSRAEECVRLLSELNEDVAGHSITEPLSDWLSRDGSLKAFNLVIVCAPLDVEPLDCLSKYTLEQSIPLIYLRSAGFYATASFQLPETFPIVDTHPDPETTQDLRLLAPWDELITAEEEVGDLEAMDNHDHGHVPWLLLLLRFLREWKQQHGTYPSSFKEKTEFRSYVASKARTNTPEGGEENFDEACAAVLKAVSAQSLASGVRDMFAMEQCTNPTKALANFWIIAHAIKTFYERHSALPLPGSLPDMKATSSGYIKLQTIYKNKARKDAAEVSRIVDETVQKLDREGVPATEIELFCKNAAFVRVITNSGKVPLAELRLAHGDAKTLAKLSGMVTNYQTISEVFLAMNAQWIPQSTTKELKSLEDLEGNSLAVAIDKAIGEVERCQGAELHNTSSIAGGLVAQEVIKLLTRQYVPVDGVAIWDGIRAKTEIVKI